MWVPCWIKQKKARINDSLHDFITKFWGTASKEYCYRKESGKIEMKAKGIGKETRSQVLSWEDYDNAIFKNGTEKKVEQRQIISYDLKNYTIKLSKKSFTGDKKRILDDDGIKTILNGHWRDVGENCLLPSTVSLPKKGTLGRLCLETLRREREKKFFPSIQA